MKSPRLFYRLRTDEILEALLHKSKAEQEEFFGSTDPELIAKQLEYIRKGYHNYRMTCKMWDLVELESNKVIGAAGYHSWYPQHNRAELGYAVHPEYQGKGYMREALKTIVEHGFDNMNLNRIEACISPKNEASLKLVKRLGFKLEGYLRQHFNTGESIEDSEMYALLASEYQP